MVDYSTQAQQFGGKPTMDYDAIARQFGGRPIMGISQGQIQAENLEYQKKAQKAQEFLAKPWYKQLFADPSKGGSFTGFSKEIERELPGAVANVILGTPARFITSALEVPKNLEELGLKGKITPKTYKIPGLASFQSYQSDAQKRAGEIVGGEKPLYTAATPFLEVPLTGLETAGLAKGMFGDIKLTGSTTEQQYTKGLLPQMVEKIKGFLDEKHLKVALNETMPVLDKMGKIEALERTGMKGGAESEGLLKKYGVKPTSKDLDVAQATNGLVKKGDPLGNIKRINNEITEVAEDVITPQLKANPIDISKENLKIRFGTKLRAIKPSTITKSDVTLKNIYDNTIDDVAQMIDDIDPKNTFDLWKKIRVGLDNLGEKTFGKGVWDVEKVTAAKEGFHNSRTILNEIIGELTPDSGGEFSAWMEYLNNLYTGRHNIAVRNYKLMDTNTLMRLWKTHPLLRGVTKAGVIGGGGYGIYRWFK